MLHVSGCRKAAASGIGFSLALDSIRGGWFQPTVTGSGSEARIVSTSSGPAVQLQTPLGLQQAYLGGKPDGTTPGGFEYYIDYVLHKEKAGEAILPNDIVQIVRELEQLRIRIIAINRLSEANLIREYVNSITVRDRDKGLEICGWVDNCTHADNLPEDYQALRDWFETIANRASA